MNESESRVRIKFRFLYLSTSFRRSMALVGASWAPRSSMAERTVDQTHEGLIAS